jgi:hypothetical protein
MAGPTEAGAVVFLGVECPDYQGFFAKFGCVALAQGGENA